MNPHNAFCMEVLFLGTGPADAIPRAGHKDALCRDAQKPHSKSRRLRSSALVSAGKTRLLIDAGPDLGYQLAWHRVERIDAVVLTHAHLDAAGGLHTLDIWARKRGVILPVYTERATEKRYGRFAHLEYVFVKAGGIAKILDLSVRFFRVRHSLQPGFPTLGFRIGKFGYASDAASVPAPSLRILHGVTTLALDAAFWFGTDYRGHMTPDKAVKVAQWLGVRRLFLTQTGHTYPPHHEAEATLRAYVRERGPGLETGIAWDGLRLKIAE